MAKIYYRNENCFDTIKGMKDSNFKVDIVLTSPPYNTARTSQTQKSIDTYNNRYDIHLDNMTDEQYCDWTVDLFNKLDEVLAENGCILYNLSYGSESPNTMWLALGDLLRKTNFMIADCIIWKKSSTLPKNVSYNKLTRITEFVFVICRKNEFKTFKANKKVTKTSRTGQKYYENVFNFIEAKNNDGACALNKATYSSDLCLHLLNIYATDNMVVYDPFMGTGTTGIACERFCAEKTMTCIGSELSEKQVEFSKNRLAEFRAKENTDNKKMPIQSELALD